MKKKYFKTTVYLTYILIAIGFNSLIYSSISNKAKDLKGLSPYLSVVSCILFADGIGRHAIELIDMLNGHLNMNFISSRGKTGVNLQDVPKSVKKTIKKSNKLPGKVTLFMDVLSVKKTIFAKNLPNSTVKLAYSVFETTALPPLWKVLLNQQFDAVIVPDSTLEEMYKNSGVKIPIFVLPLNLYIEELLAKSVKLKANKPFTFGMSASFISRKNHSLLLDAFIEEFGNSSKVMLKLHGRSGEYSIVKALQHRIATSKCSNIELLESSFSKKEYINFMASLDCYAFISKGEGFSITPREALALGIPCIISNNSAHKTICNTGFVYSVETPIAEPANYPILNGTFGYYFSPSLSDVRKALRDVYKNYKYWHEKALEGREWVKQYLAENLRLKYLSLLQPKKIILGDKNIVHDNYLMTNSEAFYRKCLNLNV